MLEVDHLAGKTFLDIGCGSGLFSLAATRLGATVHSFDYDEKSVAAARMLKRERAARANWTIERGDVTDDDHMSALGTFDVVYAWGVLHHTGAMWRALDKTCARVHTGGSLFVAIYNDQGRKSRWWHAVKRLYNRLPTFLRPLYTVLVTMPRELRRMARSILSGHPAECVRYWLRPTRRGMSRWHDAVDWVGGYPFEVATPEEVFRFCRDRGFELVNLKTAGASLGCNQFVFSRR
jgi:2-polyprenyl-6-hydroxyphenyl methylase/3-demethylubiquinone-9 3-methyltransferase